MTRVLLLEDSQDMLFILQLELSSMGYSVDVASNAMEAIELATANRPDIIVSDLSMPDIDGFEFISRVRQIPHLASVPAIAMTGFSLEREIERAKAAGFSAHLVKPVEFADLARMIEQLTIVRTQRKAG